MCIADTTEKPHAIPYGTQNMNDRRSIWSHIAPRSLPHTSWEKQTRLAECVIASCLPNYCVLIAHTFPSQHMGAEI